MIIITIKSLSYSTLTMSKDTKQKIAEDAP